MLYNEINDINENDMKNLVECVEDMIVYNFKLNRYSMEYSYTPIGKTKVTSLDSFYFECKEFLLNLDYSIKVEAISYDMCRVSISKGNTVIQECVGIEEKDVLFITAYGLIKKF